MVTYIPHPDSAGYGRYPVPLQRFPAAPGHGNPVLRVERQVENALKVVDFLSKDSHVEKVNHPALPDHPDHALYQKYFPNGGISIFTFEIKGGAAAARSSSIIW